MDTQIQGENVAPVEQQQGYVSDPNAIRAQLEAEIKAKREAAMKPPAPASPATNAPTEAPKQQAGNPPEAKAPEANKPDQLQQFRDKDGQVDPQKIEKANEHLRNGIDDRDARIQQLLKTNKELMRKFNEKSHEAKAVEREIQSAPHPLDKQAKLAHLERDAVDGIEAIAEAKARAVEERLLERFTAKEREERDFSIAEKLDDIGQKGNPWVYTPEGSAWFEQRFQEEPGLLKMRNPYSAAVQMFPELVPTVKAQRPVEAPTRGSTPILGGGHAVPPPSSAPTVSPEQQLRDMRREAFSAMGNGDLAKAQELVEKMKREDRKSIRGW